MGSFEDERILVGGVWMTRVKPVDFSAWLPEPRQPMQPMPAAEAKEERRDAAVHQLLERDIPAMLGVTLEPGQPPDPPAPTDKHGRELRAGDLLLCGSTVRRIRSGWKRGCSEFIAKVDEGCWVWLVPHALRFEVLSRGNPADPVPESFIPERDAEGRPVLESDIARYACGSVAQVGDRVVCEQIGCQHDVLEVHCEPDGDWLRVASYDGGIRVDNVRLVSRGAEHQAMTDASPRRPCCNEVGHDWNQATEICDHCGARLSVEVARGRAEPPSPQPTLQERYAAFRATVERIVAEEAPVARVVTDCGWATERDGSLACETFIAWIDGDGWKTDIGVRADGSDETLRTLLRERLGDIRSQLGARAMGRK